MNSEKIAQPVLTQSRALQKALTRHLYRQLLVSLPALAILATVVVWGVARFTDLYYLSIWYKTFIAILALRAALGIWHHYTQERNEWDRFNYIFFVINTTLIAILWGISGSFLMPHTPSSQFLVIIIMAGVTAGAIASLMASYLASALYTTFSIVPLVIWLICQGHESIYRSLAIVMATYYLFLMASGYRGYKLFVTNLKLNLEKNSLIDALFFSNSQLSLSIDNLKIVNIALHESEERFRQTFDYAAIGMALVSPDGLWLKVNKALCELSGYTESELLKMNYQTITYPEDLAVEAEHFQQMLEGKLKSYQSEKRYISKTGEIIWVLLNRVLVRDAENVPLYFISQIQNIDLQKKAETELRHIAYHDTLTQLDNRKMLEIKFHQVLGYAQRNRHHLAVLYMDLDYFKRINDSLGHDAGDDLLKSIALRLQEFKRATDILVRLSGDEFVLVFTEVIDRDQVGGLVKRLQKAVSKEIMLKGRVFTITTSIGISLYPGDGDNLQTLLAHADIALYRVKAAGRNGFQFYNLTSATN